MLEAFGAGTAAVISPVSGFYYEGKEYPIGNNVIGAGPVATRLFAELLDIQYGRKEHPWSQIIGRL